MPIYNGMTGEEIIRRQEQPRDTAAPVEEVSTSEPVTTWDYMNAYVRRENPIFRGAITLDEIVHVNKEVDPDFSAIDTLASERPDLIDQYGLNFIDVPNREAYARKVFNIDYANEQRDTMSKADTATAVMGTLGGALVDPLNLIPLTTVAKTAWTTGRVLSSAGTGVLYGGIASGVRESILLSTDETRTREEALTNMAIESAFGGILGGFIGGFSNVAKHAGKVMMSRAARGEDFRYVVAEDGASLKVEPYKDKQMSEFEKLGLAKINEDLAGTLAGPDFLKPMDLQAVLSQSLTVRKLGAHFFDSAFMRKGHLLGEAEPIRAQSIITQRIEKVKINMRSIDDDLLNIRKELKDKAPSMEELDTRVWRHVVNPDSAETLPGVIRAANKMKKALNDIYAELAELQGLKDAMPANPNYFMRSYDIDKLALPANREELENIFKTHLLMKGVPEKKATDVAKQSVKRIRGTSEEQVAMSGIMDRFISKGKFLKERTYGEIPDHVLEKFLHTESRYQFQRYMMDAIRLIETNKGLKAAGFDSIEDVKNAIIKDADELQAKATTAKENKKIVDKLNADLSLAEDMYKAMLGRIRKKGVSDKWLDALTKYQFITKMGGAAYNSLTELFMTPMRLGLWNTLKHFYLPMISNFKNLQISKQQWLHVIGAFEQDTASVLRAMSTGDGLDDLAKGHTRMDKYFFEPINKATNTFARVSLLGHLTDFNRSTGALVSAGDTADKLLRWGKGEKLSANEITDLASIGIGKDDYKAIYNQLKDWAEPNNGSWIVNPHLWEDETALKKFSQAVLTHTGSTTLKPGIETLPRFAQKSMLGKAIFQFKSFMSGATTKILIPGIQRRDARVLMGLTYLIGSGMVLEIGYSKLKGQEAPEGWDLAIAGLARTGVLGLLGTAMLDTSRYITDPNRADYTYKFIAGQTVGPSVTTAFELGEIFAQTYQHGLTERNKKAMVRMVPFMNLFYLRPLLNKMIEENN